MNNDEFIKYMVVETQDDPLYIYEKYKKVPDSPFPKMTVMREFFTGEEGIWDYDSILFLDKKSKVPVKRYNSMLGELMDVYYEYLNPSDFLEQVLPYLENEQTLNQKQEKVMNTLEYYAGEISNKPVKRIPPKLSQEEKDRISQKTLSKYIK